MSTQIAPCILLATFLFLTPYLNSEESKHPDRYHLTVRGGATVTKPADEMRINMGVTTQEKTAENALEENNTKMEKMIQALNQIGLEKHDYRTGSFSIRPIYSERPKGEIQDWKPSIIAYEVSNSLFVKTDKLDFTGALIDQATKAGANTIENIRFGLKEPEKNRAEAIQAATENAIHDARTLSAAAQVKLVRIKSISIDDAASIEPSPRTHLFKAMSVEGVPIESGSVDVSCNVTLVYEITQ